MNYKQRDIKTLICKIEQIANNMYQSIYFDLEPKQLENFNLDELLKITQKLEKLSKQLPEFEGLPF